MTKQTKQENSLLPVYLISGEDALKRDTVVKRLKKRISQLGDLSFNADEFKGEITSGEAIVSACNTVPFVSPMRLVEVRQAEKLKKADVDELITYLAKPSPSTVLALVATKLAKNTRLYKAVAKHGKTALIDCTPLKRFELPTAVRKMALNHGIKLTEGAARKLVDRVGEDTLHLNNELKKIALEHQGTDALTEHDIQAMVSPTSEVKPWEFVDAFAARDIKRCAECLNRMESVSPYALLSMCVARVRELIGARTMIQRGTPQLLAHELHLPDWRCKNQLKWARLYTNKELREALTSARNTEHAMKTGSNPADAFLDWVLKVGGKGA